MIPLIAAGIAAAATVGGAILSNKAQQKASKSAAKTSAANNAANNALAKENRDFAYGVLSPYRDGGLQAQSALSGLLYGNQPTAPALGQSTQGWREGPAQGNPNDPAWAEGALKAMNLGSRGDPVATLRGHLAGEIEGPMQDWRLQAFEDYQSQAPQTSQAVTPALAGTVTTQAPVKSAWDQFREGTNYQWRFNEGMRGLNLGLATNGYSDSGAAQKEKIKYGQNFASNELGNYINLLQNQQSIGMGAASAMVGVGSNTTGQIIANNNQGAGNAANAALVQGNATGQMWSGIAQGVGTIAGAVGSSYRPSTPALSAPTAGGYSPYSLRGIPNMPSYY